MKSIILLINSMLLPDKVIKDKQWISLREVRPFLMIILWITATRNTELSKYLYILEDRFLGIWRNNGTTFLFHYLKGVSHITIRYFANTPLTDTYKSKVLIKVDSGTGLPSIFPINLRVLIQSWNRTSDIRFIVALLSFISIFRSLKTKVPVDLSTITDPFSGKSDTLPLSTVKSVLNKDMNLYSFSPSKARTFYTTKAGPNSYNALWGAEIDAFALIHEPSVLIPYLKLLYVSRSWLFIMWYILIIILGSPYYLVSLCISKKSKPVNGRLSVVYNQAGKARVVAMTNWWIQCLFKGLHHSIFDYLRGNPCDATFDQHGRLDTFIKKCKGKVFYCYDLSAATDRLPVRLQMDILNILGYPGTLWSNIITSINWKYKSKFVKYSVGQPMGAYSSWAMLALTHHLIVKCAARIAGKDSSFSDYIVLGDDIVIADEEVAKAYLELMENLGVSINLSKSIISNEMVEFAKKWVNPSYDISPMGSGLIVQSIRERSSFVSLVTSAYERNLLTWDMLLSGYRTAPKVVKPKLQYAIWHLTLIKINLYIKETLNEKYSIKVLLSNIDRLNLREDTGMYFRWAISTHRNVSGYVHPSLEYYTVKGITNVMESEGKTIFRRNLKVLNESLRQLLVYSWRVSTLRIGMPDFFDLLLLPIKPGVWVHMDLLQRGYRELIWWAWFDIQLSFFESFLAGSYDVPSLTMYQKLWYYSELVDLNSMVHFYEEELTKKKSLSKTFHLFSQDKDCQKLIDHIKTEAKKEDVRVFDPSQVY